MKKRIFGLTASALIFAAVLTGCGSEEKVSLLDLKGDYTLSEYGSWGDENYPDCDYLAVSLSSDRMEISGLGKLYFNGKDYRLSSEGRKNGKYIFSVNGSGFDFTKRNTSGVKVDEDFSGPAYMIADSNSMTINDKEYSYVTCSLFLTAEGDDDCSAYFSFIQTIKVD
ncbi:MAG: hypothetical protein J6X85_06510 [Ruminococcus sp.]|nr:hypothetical protein [Ruminococcus sp.]